MEFCGQKFHPNGFKISLALGLTNKEAACSIVKGNYNLIFFIR